MREAIHTTAQSALLRARGIVKTFPGVKALDDVSLDVCHGEIHALVGENGAGKSTLMHILAGVHQPDSGTIDLDGQSNVTIVNEHAAQQLGISIVFQERSLFGDLSVAENIFAGRQPVNYWGHIRRRSLLSKTKELLRRVGLAVDPNARVGSLSPAQQQMVEIAKALSLDARLLILDEPTAALSTEEIATLFEVVRQFTNEGRSVIYISHRLDEVFRIAHRVTVLKDGKWQATLPVAQTSPDELVVRMVGRELTQLDRRPKSIRSASPPALVVENLHDRATSGDGGLLKNISFCAYTGEIVALAGLCGAGRTEAALAIFGARPGATADIRVDGVSQRIRSPRDAMRAGIGYLPEDRKEAGLFLEMNVAANIAAAHLSHFGNWRLDRRRIREVAETYRQRLNIATPSVATRIGNLSGGNQQKALIARWLLLHPKVLIVDEPTRGVDVGVKREVYLLLRKLAEQGTTIVVISSELPEVLALADRILVMREGVIAGELAGTDATEDAILRLASSGLAA